VISDCSCDSVTTTTTTTAAATTPASALTCDTLCTLHNNTDNFYGCAFWNYKKDKCEGSYITMQGVSVRCSWFECGSICEAEGSELLRDCSCAVATTTTTTAAVPPLTCADLCSLSNSTASGYGCDYWSSETSCTGRYVTVGALSVQCSWIPCGGFCMAEATEVVKGCSCGSAPTTTSTTTTVEAVACGALCSMVNSTASGYGCDYWSSESVCTSRYITIGDVSVQCSWFSCDNTCMAEATEVVRGCSCSGAATSTTTTTTPEVVTCGALCSMVNNTRSGWGCDYWSNEAACAGSYVTVAGHSIRCSWLSCSGMCYAEGTDVLSSCAECADTTTTTPSSTTLPTTVPTTVATTMATTMATTTAATAGSCGPAPGMNQAECNGQTYERCQQMINNEGKCSWTGGAPSSSTTNPTTTPTTTVAVTTASSSPAGSATTLFTTAATTQADTTTTLAGGWDPRPMQMTHYWDCSGQACDATTLQPWDADKYVSPPGYGPQDPANFGGSVYGEVMWLTGAASDTLTELLGDDDECCGYEDTGVGGCGKCLLVQNPDSIHPDWTAVVMKKNRCPPWTNGCGANEPHFDVAAPGFDNLAFSTANICGNTGTGFVNQTQSAYLGDWWSHGCANTAECDYRCDWLPLEFQDGCRLFASWGWTRGDPVNAKFQAVECPAAFKNHISAQFGPNGVTSR